MDHSLDTTRKPLEIFLDSASKIEDYFRNKTDKTVIFFADLANSTLYKQQRPFVLGLNKTRIHNQLITEIVKNYKGEVVKYIGDAVLARFDLGQNEHDAYLAINAAIAIQEKLHEYNKPINDRLEKIETKIGIASGIVADFYGNDPQGPIVDLTARIESNAKPNQILVHKPVLDAININKIQSQFGKISDWNGKDYISAPVRLVFKGIPEPQEVGEIRWRENFLGIKEEDKYDEYWVNYRYDATVYPLDVSYPEEVRKKYFNIIFDLRYTNVLRKTRFPFVCVNSIEDLSKAMKDSSLFSRYMLPKSEIFQDIIEKIYQVEFVRIDEQNLFEIDSKPVSGTCYYSRVWGGENIEKFVGKEITLHYRVNTIIAKRGNFFAMVTEYPTKNLSMNIDMGLVPIKSLRPIDYFASKNRPQFIYTPNQPKAKKIEVIINDWIYPRGGVVFVWTLTDEEWLLISK